MIKHLKVIKRERHYDDTEQGVTYITTLEDKTGKKGEPLFDRVVLKVMNGGSDFYNSVTDGELIKVEILNTQTKLDDHQEQPQ